MEYNQQSLEFLLDSFNNQVNCIEDRYVIPDERYQAKLILIKGMLDCLGMELTMLEEELSDIGLTRADEQEQLELFKSSHDAYKCVMKDIFKK